MGVGPGGHWPCSRSVQARSAAGYESGAWLRAPGVARGRHRLDGGGRRREHAVWDGRTQLRVRTHCGTGALCPTG